MTEETTIDTLASAAKTAEGRGRIEVSGLTKRFGAVTVVDGLDFTVEPGSVTGFLGPNGAGKTTTLRMLLGLVNPTAGTATIGGCRYVELPAPNDHVGAVLEAASFHPGRSGRDHLRVYATVNGYPDSRADELLGLVGLSEAAGRAVKGYSLGMRQRLGLATALLGDPQALVLDEPANGLDPQGIAWMRRMLRAFADEGRTVLASSHVLTEMQQLADHIVIIHDGRLVRQGSLAQLSTARGQAVSVRTPHADALVAALQRSRPSQDVSVERPGEGEVRVRGLTPAEVGHAAFVEGIELHELMGEGNDLEDVFFALTEDAARLDRGVS